MSKEILMQKGTALWLAKRTTLTNRQIADFCNMHEMEINAFRQGLEGNMIEFNPIDTFLLTDEMIKQCEVDPVANLVSHDLDVKIVNVRKGRSYAKRHEIVNAIFWVLGKHANIPNEAVAKLFGCTKNLVESIKEKTYKDYDTLIPRHPVTLELCTQEALDKMISKYDHIK